MIDTITVGTMEDATDATNQFLTTECGQELQGYEASAVVESQVFSVEAAAKDLLEGNPVPNQEGFFEPLSISNYNWFEYAKSVLPNHVVLVPSAMTSGINPSALYPAVVSEDSRNGNLMRLHVLKFPYRAMGTSRAAEVILSAAGQSETAGMGVSHSGIEPEHFSAITAVATDPFLQQQWAQGRHVNHQWRQGANTSVASEVSKRIFGAEVPEETISFSEADVYNDTARLLWHKGLVDSSYKPLTAARQDALVLAQGLHFDRLRKTNPEALTVITGLINNG